MEAGVIRRALPVALAVALLSCASPASRPSGAVPAQPQPAPPQRKTITIALQAEINALTTGLNQAAANSPPSRFFHEFTNSYLTTRDADDELVPRLATELPSVEAGTWRVLDDGRMDVTWRLRTDVKWHDGHGLTCEDLRFGRAAARH